MAFITALWLASRYCAGSRMPVVWHLPGGVAAIDAARQLRVDLLDCAVFRIVQHQVRGGVAAAQYWRHDFEKALGIKDLANLSKHFCFVDHRV
ncbi:hypothetical protein XarbCFBP8152_16575 [Xanthomonas arboricola]|nr:hypothetical protein XarbCFBP8152_16575 [Xanthomonas arboricola]